MPEKDYSALLEAGGYFISILGAMVLGIAVGMGITAYMVKSRFRCGSGLLAGQDWLFINGSRACSEVLGAANSMVLASTVGGTVAFGCGLVVMAYAKKDGDADA